MQKHPDQFSREDMSRYAERFKELIEELDEPSMTKYIMINKVYEELRRRGFESAYSDVYNDICSHALHHKAYGADYIENILYQEMTPQNHHQPVKLKNQSLNHIRLTEPSLAEYDTYILKRRDNDD